jgi:hypothetical protein
MAVCAASGDTLPGNLPIIPSAQKWVFHAIYQYAFLHLYSSEVCSQNRLILTDKDTSQYKPFESLISTTNVFNQSKVMICMFHGIQMGFKTAIISNYGKLKNCTNLWLDNVSNLYIQFVSNETDAYQLTYFFTCRGLDIPIVYAPSMCF